MSFAVLVRVWLDDGPVLVPFACTGPSWYAARLSLSVATGVDPDDILPAVRRRLAR